MPKVLEAKMFGMNIWNFGDGQLFVYFQLFVYIVPNTAILPDMIAMLSCRV